MKSKKKLKGGRPKGSGHYGEECTPIRIPESLIPEVIRLLQKFAKEKKGVEGERHVKALKDQFKKKIKDYK